VSFTESPFTVTSDDLELTGGLALPENPRGGALLLHGIPSVAPSAPDDTGYAGLARRFSGEGWAAVWLNMRAAKDSPGFFSIEGWVRDATAGIKALRGADFMDGLPLVVLGSSAGGAVATEALRRGAQADALVLLAAPATWVSFAVDAAAAVDRIEQGSGMPVAPDVVADPTEWAEEFNHVATEEAIGELKIPILIVHGKADDVVPVEHADRLVDNANDAKVVLLDDGLHQLRRDDRALNEVLLWLNRTLPSPQS
jgi:dipeptidyl aminopeptidase/acylaminoacyl peptidase